MKNDYLFDDIDYLIILTIGEEKIEPTKIQKIALLLSKLLNIPIDVEAYYFGGYSETIAERLNSTARSQFFTKSANMYELTGKGKEVYYKLLEKLKTNKKENIIKILTILRKISVSDILALTYFLYPETTEKSIIRSDIIKTIETLKEMGKKYFKVEKHGDEIVIEILGGEIDGR
jgi:hypothetical protein